jgi:peptidoglycan hydrolase CwlO-like protein
MFSSAALLSVFGTLIIVLLAAAGAVGTFAALRVGRHAQTVKNFSDAARSWREKAEAQESDLSTVKTDNAALQAEVTTLQAQVAALQAQVAALRELVRPVLQELLASPASTETTAKIRALLDDGGASGHGGGR